MTGTIYGLDPGTYQLKIYDKKRRPDPYGKERSRNPEPYRYFCGRRPGI